MTNNKWLWQLLILIILVIIGFYLGRSTSKVNIITKTEYFPGDTIRDSIPVTIDRLIKVDSPIDTVSILKYCIDNHLYDYLIPERVRDSIVYVQVDSSKIVRDWLLKRTYDIELFNIDTLGSLRVRPKIQYNTLIDIPYEFNPVNKTIITEIIKRKKFEPMIGFGLNSKDQIGALGGIFRSDGWGVMYQYQYNLELNNSSHGIYLLKKF